MIGQPLDRFMQMQEEWQLAGMSVVGESHQAEGTPCEDAHFVDQTANGFAVAAVSDGAGSAELGGFAAATICESFRSLCARLSELEVRVVARSEEQDKEILLAWEPICSILDQSICDVRNALLQHAQDHGKEARCYLATLLGVIAHPVLGATLFHIGDGATSAFDELGGAVYTSQPENGEYLNQSYFLVEEHWVEHYRTKLIMSPPHEFFVMSDGVTELAYVRNGRTLTPEPKFFRPISEFLCTRDRSAGESGLLKMLNSPRALAIEDDDKTLIWLKIRSNATG